MAKKEIQKIIVIGSNSFSAGSLIDLLLAKKFKVYGISRSKLNNKKFLRFDHQNKNFIFKKLDLNKDHNKIITLIIFKYKKKNQNIKLEDEMEIIE